MNSGTPRFESHRERRASGRKRARTSSRLLAQEAGKDGRIPPCGAVQSYWRMQQS
jgi:hypothetical protein